MHPKDMERRQLSYLRDKDYISKANEMGISESTARCIVRRKNSNLRTGKHESHKQNITLSSSERGVYNDQFGSGSVVKASASVLEGLL